MTFHVVIIVAIVEIREKRRTRQKNGQGEGGRKNEKKDDESIACQVSVGSGGFFLSVSNDVITL